MNFAHIKKKKQTTISSALRTPLGVQYFFLNERRTSGGGGRAHTSVAQAPDLQDHLLEVSGSDPVPRMENA